MLLVNFDAQSAFIITVTSAILIYYFVFSLFPFLKYQLNIWLESQKTLEKLEKKEHLVASQEKDLIAQLDDEIKFTQKRKVALESNNPNAKQPFVLKYPVTNNHVQESDATNDNKTVNQVKNVAPETHVERKLPQVDARVDVLIQLTEEAIL